MFSHSKECKYFIKKFVDIDKKISRSIKYFIDNIDKSDNNNYINDLSVLQFFLKRYLDSIEEKIKTIIKKRNSMDNNIKNQIFSNKNINSNYTKSIPISSSFPPLNNNQSSSLGFKQDIGSQNYIFPITNESIKTNDNTFNSICNYCEKVYQQDSNFDKDLLKVMSYSIGALTSKECFIAICQTLQNDKVVISSDDGKKFYSFKYFDTNFLVILY